MTRSKGHGKISLLKQSGNDWTFDVHVNQFTEGQHTWHGGGLTLSQNKAERGQRAAFFTLTHERDPIHPALAMTRGPAPLTAGTKQNHLFTDTERLLVLCNLRSWMVLFWFCSTVNGQRLQQGQTIYKPLPPHDQRPAAATIRTGISMKM